MNNKHYFLFIVKNISCVQFSSCHTSDENFLTPNFSQTTVYCMGPCCSLYVSASGSAKILIFQNIKSTAKS